MCPRLCGPQNEQQKFVWRSLQNRGWGRTRAAYHLRNFPGLVFQNPWRQGSWWGKRRQANQDVLKPGSVSGPLCQCPRSLGSQDQDTKDGQSKHRAPLESHNFPPVYILIHQRCPRGMGFLNPVDQKKKEQPKVFCSEKRTEA